MLQIILATHCLKLMPKSRKLREPLPERTCKNCSKLFVPYRSWQEFCEPQCRNLFYWKTHKVVRVEGSEQIVPSIEAVPVQTSQ